MKEMVYQNKDGRKVVITVYAPKSGTEYIVNLDYYNHRIFKTLKGAQRYLERNGYSEV